ncbi:sugar transferase (plasmid) [Phyllobacterium sp. K27]
MSYITEPLIEQRTEKMSAKSRLYYDVVKRTLDVTLASLALIFLLPLLICIVCILAVTDGFPIVFKQHRIGLNGREFTCFKFRSMAKDADARLVTLLAQCPDSLREWTETQKLKTDPRIHRVGRFLRISSLDELPQLINVLRGEMSIVGPRPIVMEEICRYGDSYRYYTEMKPGITGLWQVSGRSGTGYDRRVQLDTDYFKSRSIWGDMKIMIRTVSVVLLAKGSC